MIRTFAVSLVALLVLTTGASAQYGPGATGLRWVSPTSTGGQVCFGFSCTSAPITVTPGETGTLTIYGALNQPYIIGLSLTATSCDAVPGFLNSLVLDNPITIVWTGTLSQPSPILACPPGFDTFSVQVPLIPSGFTFALQGAAVTNGLVAFLQPAFTTPLAVTVL